MSEWTFITRHGAVLALIGQHSQITAREIATRLGITERYVRKIIKDLETNGYIEKKREGRVNTYRVNGERSLRRKEQRDVAVSELLKVIGQREG
jgi:DNA-binding MarR family transcriptional regulator